LRKRWAQYRAIKIAKEKKMTFQKAFKVFTKTLRSDPSLYVAYQANIAMAYYDCSRWEGSRDSSRKRHTIGNRAAKYFLDLLIHPPLKDTKSAVRAPNNRMAKRIK
jgi:hypothetical protein